MLAALLTSPAGAAPDRPTLSFAAPLVTGTTATVSFTLDRPAKSIVIERCVLSIPGKLPTPVDCGTPTGTSTSTTYTTTLLDLPIGTSTLKPLR